VTRIAHRVLDVLTELAGFALLTAMLPICLLLRVVWRHTKPIPARGESRRPCDDINQIGEDVLPPKL
jgi:hypothetical protein